MRYGKKIHGICQLEYMFILDSHKHVRKVLFMDQPSKVYRSHSPTACKLSHRTDSS